MESPALPHTYPFRFVDVVSEERDAGFSRGRARARVSANGWGARGETWQSSMLFVEAIAQAALLLERGDVEAARGGYLAGIEAFEAERSPFAGETLEISVHLAARFGAMFRFDGEVRSEGAVLARGSVLVRHGEQSAPEKADFGR